MNTVGAAKKILLVLIISMISCGSANLDTDIAKVSYGIGTQFANDMKNRGFELDMKAFNQAVEDVLKGKESRISDADIRMAFQKVSEELMKKAMARAEENAKAGEDYLKKNGKKDGVKVTASGLQYRVLKEGSGVSPAATSMVKVHYKGTLIDGKEFDSSYKRNQPVEFKLDEVIPGWTEGLQLMKTGAKYEFTIPSELGYGERGNNAIPGNSVLVFEVELLEVK